MKKCLCYSILCFLATSSTIHILNATKKENLKETKTDTASVIQIIQKTLEIHKQKTVENKSLVHTLDKESKKVLLLYVETINAMKFEIQKQMNGADKNNQQFQCIVAAILKISLSIATMYGTNFTMKLLEQTGIIELGIFKRLILSIPITLLLKYQLLFIMAHVPSTIKFFTSLPKSILDIYKRKTGKKYTIFDEIMRAWRISGVISHMAKRSLG